MDETFKKIFQKRVYDLLSHKYGILMLIFGGFLIMVSALHFGEAWLEWSHEKYDAVFNSFSDNIAGKSFRERLSVPLPIDVVYTWVNGTDPGLIRQLELVKISLEVKSNLTREERCTFTNCVSVGILIYPPLSGPVAVDDVIKADAVFMNITGIRDIKEHPDWPSNFSLLTLEHEPDVKYILKHMAHGWTYRGTNHTIKPAYYTSDMKLPHGIVIPEVIMLSGFPNEFSDGDVQQAVTGRLNVSDKASVPVKLHKDKGIALLYISQKAHYDQLSKDKNFTIEHKVQRLSRVKLVWDLRFAVKDDVVASNRFEDNEELRYSLRSLEQFAPWVRHVYIVTNGQIPYWLNLDCPRITVITHDEIFENISHLPTFSSPAIEANIHKIPGLSDKFLYLNDDVMFGSPVWPDDFYTHSTGQKLYLTWPVPNCNEGCPSTWIRDGYCDKACNSSECDWDGGDCLASNGRVQLGAGFHDQGPRLTDYTSYCNTGCANNWLADKYCDQACNNLQCGFDIGDCGVSNYNKLFGLDLQSDKLHYRLPPGELIGYFNLSRILTSRAKVTSASYSTDKVIRAVAVANKFKVLTVVLNKDHNATTLIFDLEYKLGTNETGKINFTLQVDTSVAKSELTSNNSNKLENVTTTPPVKVEDILDAEAFTDYTGVARDPVLPHDAQPVELNGQHSLTIDLDILDLYRDLNMSMELKEKLSSVDQANREGELTETGLKVRFYDILRQHGAELERLQPMFREQRLKLEIQKAEEAAGRKIQNLIESPKQSVDGMKGPFSNKEPHLELRFNEGRKPQKLTRRERLQQLQDKGQQDVGGQGQYGLKRSFNSVTQNVDKIDSREVYQTGSLLHAEPRKSSLHIEKGSLRPGRNAEGPPPAGSVFRPGYVVESSPSLAGKVQNSMRDSSYTIVKTPSKLSDHNAKELYGKAKAARQREEHPDADAGLEVRQERMPAVNKLGIPENNNNTNNNITGSTQGDDNIRRGAGRKLLAILYWSQMEEQREKNRIQMKDDSLGEKMTDEEFLRLVNIDVAGENVGGFPWERKDIQGDKENSREKERKSNEYTVEGWQGRQLLDTFGDSLRHVNHIYNKEFGFQPRKVPGHMPHMIDRNIMYELQKRFPKEWDETSSHKIRSSTDMQYAFAYYYYMMGVTVAVSVEDVFNQMDTDHSGVLSDREIRTLAARMYDLPLYLETLTGLEAMFSNCSQNFSDFTHLTEDTIEHYYEKSMPQVTKHLFINCDAIAQLVKSKVKPKLKYKTSPVDDSDITFKMIHTNVSHVVGQLDDIRKHPKKFICLNDNIDHTREEAKTVKAILQDFYESLLPIPSQFELPRDYRNRFLHMNDLREWRSYRDRLRFWTHVALVVLVLLAIMSFLGDKVENLRRRWSNRKHRRRRTSSSNELTPSGSVTPSPRESSTITVWDSMLETV